MDRCSEIKPDGIYNIQPVAIKENKHGYQKKEKNNFSVSLYHCIAFVPAPVLVFTMIGHPRY